MAKKARVSLVARRLGVPTQELLMVLRDLGERVRGPASPLAAPAVAKLAEHYGIITPVRDDNPRQVERLKVAAAKKELGIATALDLHELEMAARAEPTSQEDLIAELMRPSPEETARRQQRRAERKARNPTTARPKRKRKAKQPAKSEPIVILTPVPALQASSSAAKKPKRRAKQQIAAVTGHLGYSHPKSFDESVRTVVSSGLPTLGRGRR